ncbi:hypothetical protein Tco_0654067 [Tanacetum coccineum]|uniref:Uncharacterized protein n=1 Tax=Tanacetum coccineum TaxID=301880 RepID=A0ABQ4X2I4_9ASTR
MKRRVKSGFKERKGASERDMLADRIDIVSGVFSYWLEILDEFIFELLRYCDGADKPSDKGVVVVVVDYRDDERAFGGVMELSIGGIFLKGGILVEEGLHWKEIVCNALASIGVGYDMVL